MKISGRNFKVEVENSVEGNVACNNAAARKHKDHPPTMKLHKPGPHETEVSFANGTIILFSYSDPVCAFKPGLGWVKSDKFFSKTTNRHINDFILRHAKEHVVDVPHETIIALVGAI